MTIISTDMLLAIPIVLLSMAALSSSIINMQSYYIAYARSSYSQIRYYSISQQMLEVLGSQNLSQGQYINSTRDLGAFYNVSADITGISNYSECSESFCRIVQSGAMSRIMVIR